MSCMFEVYYLPPANARKEADLTARISQWGGWLSYREVPDEGVAGSVCLTYEFTDSAQAETAAAALREQGEHVEGPMDYSNT